MSIVWVFPTKSYCISWVFWQMQLLDQSFLNDSAKFEIDWQMIFGREF